MESIYEWDENHFDKWQFWKINNIIVEISDILNYELIKIEDYEGYIHEYKVPQSQGVKWVYDNILKNYRIDERCEVWVHDIKTRVLKYRIE
jgi:hypothetical protein